MSCFLGIDLGTSYFKVGIFNGEGSLLGLGRQPVEKETKKDTVCELPTAVFWKTLHLCISDALQHAGINSKDITAVSYSSQANSFVLLDKFDKPLTPLVLWPDNRAKTLSSPLFEVVEKTDFQKITGLGIVPGSLSIPLKLFWYQKEQPQLWSQVKSIMSISDYLVFGLTGQRVTDFSTSSMTGLFNVLECKWWQEAIDVLNIQEGQLSNPLKVGSLAGSISYKGAQLAGLPQNIDLFLGGLDHHMVGVGAGLPYLNYISESTGTVLACVNYQEGYRPRTGVNIAPGLKDNFYFEMAYDENGATALEWYKNKYAPELTIPDLLDLAEKVEEGSNGLIAQPSADKFPELNGFKNIENIHQDGHFVRAILESTGLSLSYLVNKLAGAEDFKKIVSSGGGAKSSLWIQIKANILNTTFLTPECSELACQGAAMISAVGASYFKNMDEAIKNQTRFDKITCANPTNVEKYKKWSINLKK